MTARKAMARYPGSVKASNGNVKVRDSDCRAVEIPADAEIYHRGHGCFGIVTDELDRGEHWSWGGGHKAERVCSSHEKGCRKAKHFKKDSGEDLNPKFYENFWQQTSRRYNFTGGG